MVGDQRGVLDLGLHLGALVVEHPQGVDLDARPGGLVEVEPAQEVLEGGAVGGAALLASEGVQQQPHPRQPECLVTRPGDRDGLGVDRGVLGADGLHVELLELAVAARLRALVAERRAGRPELHRELAVVQAVLQRRAHHPGGELGPQRDRAAAPVGEGVHLLGHDVGRLADAPGEQLGVLEDGNLDIGVAGVRRRGGERLADREEDRGARWEIFGYALGRLKAHYSPLVGPANGTASARYGFVARSRPIVVCGP